MKRKANAHWAGSIKEGKGNLSTASGILEHSNYSFKTRFQDEEKGTNPEELLAAAHAGCFTMAVSYALTGDRSRAKIVRYRSNSHYGCFWYHRNSA